MSHAPNAPDPDANIHEQPRAEGEEGRDEAAKRPLTPAAKRALAEAQARRAAETPVSAAREIGGRGGADPARFGDWEIKGRAIDF